MGKGILLVLVGSLLAGSVMFLQSSETRISTTTRQALYQRELLAREIARSAHGIARLKLQQASSNYDLAVGNINGWNHDGTVNMGGKMTGSFQGGSFEVRAMPMDGQNIKLKTVGIFDNVRETITSYHRIEMLVVTGPSKLTAEFLQSEAGYCSAVFLQQYIPIAPGDSTGAITGVVSADGAWFIKNPEMIFVSGHDRDGTTTTPADLLLDIGTRMNFFIGVDPDCSEEGVVTTYNPANYDWEHHALVTESSVTQMQEGKFAMIEQHPSAPQTWRIAFEDLTNFSDAQHADIKANGYGGNNTWNESTQTYGGSGWTSIDEHGYNDLDDHGSKPDFSDQVIEITLEACDLACQSGEEAT